MINFVQQEVATSEMTTTCTSCKQLRQQVRELREEVSHLQDRLESAQDQVMSFLLKQRSRENSLQRRSTLYSSLVESQHQNSVIGQESPVNSSEPWDTVIISHVLEQLQSIKNHPALQDSLSFETTLTSPSSSSSSSSSSSEGRAETNTRSNQQLPSAEKSLIKELITQLDTILSQRDNLLGDGSSLDELPRTSTFAEAASSPTVDCLYKGEHSGEQKRHGFGISDCLLTGLQFVGQHTNDDFTFGIAVLPDGSCYIGPFQEQQPHGKGLSLTTTGALQIGEWVDGAMQGQGTMAWHDGKAFYNGSWQAGQMHGHGEYLQRDGTRYTGEWTNGKMQGRGVLEYPTGNRYEGSFDNNMKSGSGTLTFAKGGQYVGYFVENEYHDEAAIYSWADGSVYQGNYQNGRRSGQGVLRKADGRVYDGEWQDNKRHGSIIFIDRDGAKFSEQWNHGKRVKRTAI